MTKDAQELEREYFQLIEDSKNVERPTQSSLQKQEGILLNLGKVYQKEGDAKKLYDIVSSSRDILGNFAKSKTAKIMRTLIEGFDEIPNALDLQIKATKECIDWAVKSKLSFLRQYLQLKLSDLLYHKGLYPEALKIITELLRECKKLDDKSSLVEIQLLESKICHALRNIPKARAALTSARTSANSIYCPTILQAELDCQSGIINTEEKDYKTAFSYFYESFEGYNSQNDSRAVVVLKYMLLTKIMLNLLEDVHSLLNNKSIMRYQSRDLDAMKAVATAYSNRSLKEFEQHMLDYSEELRSDSIIKNNFNVLYDNLLEQNLLKIIDSYSCVELSHVSETIGLDLQQVEGKLSQMILDKVFYGVLDQGNGWLIIYDQPKKDATYQASLELVKDLSSVVDSLYDKAASLN